MLIPKNSICIDTYNYLFIYVYLTDCLHTYINTISYIVAYTSCLYLLTKCQGQVSCPGFVAVSLAYGSPPLMKTCGKMNEVSD